MNKPLTIGHLARSADVNIETVRYYQRFGIITEPARPLSGYRIYPQHTVDRIRFIKRAQQLGFSLQEIAELLDLGEGLGEGHCEDVRIHAQTKLEHVDQQIKDLKGLRQTLKNLIKSCQSGDNNTSCPIVETLIGKPAKLNP